MNCIEVPFDLDDYSAWLSCDPRRAPEAGVVLFDRFARADKLLRLEKNMKRLFFQGRFYDLPAYITLSRRHCFSPPPKWRYPRQVVLCLPVLLAGSKVGVSLAAISIYGKISLSKELAELWEDYFASRGIHCLGGFFASKDFALKYAGEPQREAFEQ